MSDNEHHKLKRKSPQFAAFERLTKKLMAVPKKEIDELEAKRKPQRNGGRRPMLRRA